MQSVRISSKRQIALPVNIFNGLNLKQGDRLVIEVIEDSITMRKGQNVLDSLAGSLSTPAKFKRKSLEYIKAKAKQEYFSKKI